MQDELGFFLSTSEGAMSDIINYADSEDSSDFPIHTGDECKSRPSGSKEHPKPPDKNKLKGKPG